MFKEVSKEEALAPKGESARGVVQKFIDSGYDAVEVTQWKEFPAEDWDASLCWNVANNLRSAVRKMGLYDKIKVTSHDCKVFLVKK